MVVIDLSGKCALVTGASGELGRVMARTLARCGADVAVHYHRNGKAAAALVAEIEAMGRRALAVQADVTDARSVERMRRSVEKDLAAPSIVVANAVIQYRWTSVLDQSASDYESQFRSSVLQNVLLAKTFIPSMRSAGWGRYIGINTECTMQCWPSQSAYVSGKGGMDRVLRVLAKEVGGDGITVNQVAPGWTVSENRPDSDAARSYREQVPLRRRGVDQEIANAVVFLASDLASYVSGVYLPVCGGNVMPAV